MVFNNTKVLPARLFGRKESGGKVELLLLSPESKPGHWLALAKSSKNVKPGRTITFENGATVTVVETLPEGRAVIDFGSEENARAIMDREGQMPLPPYIERPNHPEEALRNFDRDRYQTVYAREEGAVAAPTAGLHFTDRILGDLEARGIERVFVTLHVGLGTFLPVRVDDVTEHKMHSEWCRIEPDAAEKINRVREKGGRILAVGTTSCRTLESSADESGRIIAGDRDTDLFIYPGYRFRVVDAMLTNFHLPGSTLIMLISALAGREHVLAAYEHAVENRYRFYSYGDAMLIV